MDGILNEGTNTLHKQDAGKSDLHAVCGATYHLSRDRLKPVAADETKIDTVNARKCGRCFDDGGRGGY